jgi:hypothetical protein
MFYFYKRGKQLFSERECNAVLRLVKKDRRFNLRDIINQFNDERDRLLKTWVICTNKTYLSIKHMGYIYK